MFWCNEMIQNNSTMSSSPKILSASKKYRWLVLLIFLGMILLGLVFMQLTESYIQELKQLSQDSPRQAMNKSAFLLVFIAMAAGFPAVGIGAYFIYQGNQIRVTRQFPSPGTRVIVDTPIIEGSPAILRGHLLMVGGGLVIVSGLALPIIAWWVTENF